MNLLTNAAHAMKEKGGNLNVELQEIELNEESASRYQGLEPGRYLRLRISDSGVGIPDAIINKIFDPFFTTKERGEGTGMGLSIVHGIVKDMKGFIMVFSESGKGATFQILLPVSENVTAGTIPEQVDLKRGSALILFVDDEEDILKSGRGILKQLGYHIVSTSIATEALEIFSQSPEAFDLVITDLTMPKMTGLELAELIHKIRPDIPIVLCTGFGFGIIEDRIKEVGISDMVMKPMIPSELAEIIYNVLNPDPA